ncbi:MAG: hypothetical protein EOP56_03615 [Sphingobacteriales bacterium]|nr:MAG: hypothetical protein EOP56_03615 [Sphingobacteriales bacterium]
MKAGLKTILLSVLGTFAAFSAVTFNSCNNDKCKAIVCSYGGVCKEGTCICQSGYEGPQCETVIRDRYLGTWAVRETGSFTNSAIYTLSIEGGDNMTEVIIHNIYNKLKVKGNINRDTLLIPQQNINNYIIQGRGVLQKTGTYGQNGVITMRYSVYDPVAGLTDEFGMTENHGSSPSEWSR